jgi:hypothetical protein
LSDIVTRLRRWTHAVDAAPASDLMDEAAREIEMLRMALTRIADHNATFSVIGGNIIVDVEPTLTDKERKAIKAGIECCEDITYGGRNDAEAAAVLRRLLERLG